VITSETSQTHTQIMENKPTEVPLKAVPCFDANHGLLSINPITATVYSLGVIVTYMSDGNIL